MTQDELALAVMEDDGSGSAITTSQAERDVAEAERVLNEKIAYARSLPFSRLGLFIATRLTRREAA